jgi:hypothetical protein
MAGKASKTSAKVARKAAAKRVAQPALLAGGNPQIAKADGDAPVQAYIAAMPGWKRDIGRGLDALIVRTAPDVRKAVRWNSPFYGIEGQGWFLSLHCFTKYVKVAFFRGTSLHPLPPGESKHEEVRYLDIHEDDQLDEAQVAAWVKQASQLPGWGNEGPVMPDLRRKKPKRRKEENVMRKSGSRKGKSPSLMIDERLKELGDWRGTMLSQLRALIKQADPEVVEEWKWRGVPVWSHDGLICTGETYKNVVKMTFAKGAALGDPSRLFDSSLEGNTRRAIDFHEGEKIDEKALKALIRAAVTLNASRSSR